MSERGLPVTGGGGGGARPVMARDAGWQRTITGDGP